MSVTINKKIRVTGEAPFVETFAVSSANAYVTNVKQTPGVGYSDYEFDIVYRDSASIATTTISMNVTSNCGNAASYTIPTSSPCGSYALSSIVKDASATYRYSVTVSNTSCTDVTVEWEYNKALFEGVVTTRGLKSTLNLSLREDIPINSFDTGYKIKVTATDCNGCEDTSEASYTFCKASFKNITHNIVTSDTSEYQTLYSIVSNKPNGYYISKPDGTLAVVNQPSADAEQNKIMLVGIEFTEFETADICFNYDSKDFKFSVLTTQYDVKQLGYAEINGSSFHVFVAHAKYQEYYNTGKAIEIQYKIESTEGVESFPAKIILNPQAEVVEEITLNFIDSQFFTNDGLTNPLDGTIVDACGYDNTDVIYIQPKINLNIGGQAYLDTSGATFGQNFFSSTDSRLTVVPAPNSGALNTPFLFKYTFDDTIANTVPLVIPYTLHVTSSNDSTIKAYNSANLTIKSLCTDSISLTGTTLSKSLSCADYDDGTYDNIVETDISQLISGTYTPSGLPIVVVTLPTEGTFQTFRNSTKVKYIADLCQHGTFTAVVKLRDINGIESDPITITYTVDCVGKDYYTRFCNIQ
jgi:hypothetical protein